MADKNIKIQVIDKKATVIGAPVIVCGNSDYTATITFDAEWSLTGPKTARFVYVRDGKVQHEDVAFSGNVVAVPVLVNVDFVDVGVFAGNLCTTTPARVPCRKSILCGSGVHHDPTPDIYDQIMKLFEDLAEAGAFGATEAQAQQIEKNKQDIAQLEAAKADQVDVDSLASRVGQNSQSITKNAQDIAQLDATKAKQTDMAALAARMDTFTKLEEGSTTGDAELADIHVGYDGTQYETAGAAVRGQASALAAKIEEEAGQLSGEIANSLDKGYVGLGVMWEQGNIDSGTGVDSDTSQEARVRNVGYISTNGNVTIYNTNSERKYAIRIYYYDANNSLCETKLLSDKQITLDTTYPYARAIVADYTNGTWEEKLSVSTVVNDIFVARPSEKIREIESEILELKNSSELKVPAYFETNLSEAVAKINDNMRSVGKNGETFIFITDLHWEQNAQNSPSLVKYVLDNTEVKQVVCGGDLISQGEKVPMMLNMQNCMNAFRFVGADFKVLFGNHDNNMNTQTDDIYSDRWFSDNECYTLMQKRAETIVNYGDYFYFYFDNPTTKTRYICLDTRRGEMSVEQFAWLDNVLALDDDYNVIIFAHILWRASTWNDPLSGGVWATWATTLFSKADAYGDKVKAIFYGHIHADKNDFTDGGIPVICTDTDSKYCYGEYTATVGTISEQCFDVVTINYDTNVIKCVRVGRGVDRIITRE